MLTYLLIFTYLLNKLFIDSVTEKILNNMDSSLDAVEIIKG